MAFNTLRVRARGTALVQDYAAMEAGIRRYIGRKADPKYIDPEKSQGLAFVPTDEVFEVAGHHLQWRHEYARHVAHGDLWPADEATAKECGVSFDPTFGGALKELN